MLNDHLDRAWVVGRFVTHAGNEQSFPLCSLDIMIMADAETYADFRFGDVARIVKVPKSETQMSADLRDEADRIDDLAHALTDHLGRKVVVVWPDDEEVVVEPRPEQRLDN